MPTLTRKCTGCKDRYLQVAPNWIHGPAGWFHDYQCLIDYADRQQRKKNRRNKIEFNRQDRSWWLKKTQAKVNEYIRLRDKHQPCISCGAVNYRITAGHYRSVGAAPELRFNEHNIHGQCWFNCNSNQSGNLIEYRKGLIERYGVDYVTALEAEHPPQHYSIDDLKEIYEEFAEKVKTLKKRAA